MKLKLFFTTLLIVILINAKSQTINSKWNSSSAITSSVTNSDKWDTTYKSIIPYTTGYGVFIQQGVIALNNRLILYGDTGFTTGSNFKSYLYNLNTITNTLTQISYTKTVKDYGFSTAASIITNTSTNQGYVFFGCKNSSALTSDSTTIYKLNTLTNSVTSESYNEGSSVYRNGISNVVFFSPTTNHDSLLIFSDSLSAGSKIYKKQVNQTGVVKSNILLPIDKVDKSIVFNNELYVAGRASFANGYLFKSTNGLSFSIIASPTNVLGYQKYVTDMDTLNNELYLALYDADGFCEIVKTTSGTTFTIININNGKVTSLKNFRKKMWYSLDDDPNNTGRPNVYYLKSATTETLSIDTIGRKGNMGRTFKLAVATNSLYLLGNYKNLLIEYGLFIYKFLPPLAAFTPSNSTYCLNKTYTLTNISQNADSVRWIEDGNNYASTSNTFITSFTTTGSHTLGLIAIAGTQKDTAIIFFNVYNISNAINGTTLACESTTFQLTSTVLGAVGALNYTWFQSPISFSTSVGSASAITVPTLIPGYYSYSFNVTDANLCSATSPTLTVSVQNSKNIIGTVLTSISAPVSGSVTLYRYEPVLTKFDSISTVAMDIAGNYTFTNATANTYLIKALPTNTTQQITYCPSALSWQTATQINHGCVNTATQNITIVDLINIGSGPGILAGTLTQGAGYGQKTNGILTGPIKGTVVKGGRNPGGNYFAEARTNGAGQYSFTNVPVCAPGESYFILVDIPGLDTNGTYHRVISTNSLSYTNLDFVVDSAKVNPIGNVIGIKEFLLVNDKVVVYPNPAKYNILLEYELSQEANISIEITNVLGQTIIPQKEKIKEVSGKHKKSISTSVLNSGIYFIKLKINDVEKTIKFIII